MTVSEELQLDLLPVDPLAAWDLRWHEPTPDPKGRQVSDLAKLARLATDHGWVVMFVVAAGPPVNMTMRVRRGPARAYGLWVFGEGVRFRGGCHNIIDGSGSPVFTTLKSFTEYLGSGQ